MKIDFEQEILSFTGEPFVTDQKMENGQIVPDSGVPLTLGTTCARSLTNMVQADQKLSGDEKAKYGLLAIRIFETKDEMTVSVEEIVLLKERVGMMYNPVVCARVFEMLDPS